MQQALVNRLVESFVDQFTDLFVDQLLQLLLEFTLYVHQHFIELVTDLVFHSELDILDPYIDAVQLSSKPVE